MKIESDPALFNSLQLEVEALPTNYALRAGFGFGEAGVTRHFLRAGLRHFPNEGIGYSGGYGVALAPLYPWMEWNLEGFRLGEFDLEVGAIDSFFSKSSVGQLFGYAIGTLDGASWAFQYGYTKTEVLRFSLGASFFVQPHFSAPAAHAGLQMEW